MKVFICFALYFCLVCSGVSIAIGQDLSPQELINKHLDAVASKEKRSGLKNITAIGTSEFVSRNPYVQGGGRAVVVSDNANLLFAMSFNSLDYPFEKIGFFGSKPNIPYVNAGRRSLLGSFLMEHGTILSEGLFSGIFSLRWPLSNIDKNKAKVRISGKKKLDNVEAYVLEYIPARAGSSQFFINLYFDAVTFNHIRSEYRREIPAGRIVFGQQNQIASSNLNLTEYFSDFKSVEGFNLPHSYKVKFVSNSGASTVENSWAIKVLQYRFDQDLEPDFFSFDAGSRKQD